MPPAPLLCTLWSMALHVEHFTASTTSGHMHIYCRSLQKLTMASQAPYTPPPAHLQQRHCLYKLLLKLLLLLVLLLCWNFLRVLQSVKDMPIVQDMPPVGGFPSIRIQRRLPSTGPTGMAIFAVGGAVMAYGYYQVS